MKRQMKKGLAIVLALVMVFAMTATAFASTNDNITVTVRFDTRSYDLSAKMLKSDAQTPVSNSPVVEYTVSVPAGSTALAAVQKAADDHGFDVITKNVVDYYDSTKTHQAITDIGRIGETYIDPTLKNAFITLPDTSTRGYYYVSGWVYGITPSNSTEFFPYNYMSDYTVSDGMKITMHYSVTGPYNIETGNWTSDYSNLDVTMWNLYDKIAALDPNDGFGALSYTTGTITTGANVAQNTTGLTAYYFSHNGLTSEADEQLIPWLQAILASLEA